MSRETHSKPGALAPPISINQTSLSRYTHRSLQAISGVGQQYPPVLCTRATRGNAAGRPCTETQCTNECRVEGWRGSFWTAGGRGHLAATRWRPTVDDRKHRQSGYIEVTAHGESTAYSRKYAVGRSGCFPTYGLQRTYMIVRCGHTDTAVVPAERACDRQTQAVL